MNSKLKKEPHTVSRLTCHIVWPTKYRDKILRGDIQKCCRELLIQVCEIENIEILKGVVNSGYVHMHIEYAPKLSVSYIIWVRLIRTNKFG